MANLLVATERMRLSSPAREAARQRHWSSRPRKLRVRIFVARFILTAGLATFFVLFAKRGTNTVAWHTLISCGTGMVVLGLWYSIRSTALNNRARYLAARRMRENGLTRRAPIEFAPTSQPLSAVSDPATRRSHASVMLQSQPSARSLAAHAFDSRVFRLSLYSLLPVYGMSHLLMIWDLPGRSVVPMIMSVFYPALFVAMGISLFRLKSRARRALQHTLCPDCGYSLANIPPAPSSLRPTLNLGPKCCPECGSPWPLILFPAPFNST